MASLEASLKLNDQFTKTLESIDSSMQNTLKQMNSFEKSVTGPSKAFQSLSQKAQEAVNQMNSKVSSGMTQLFDKMQSSNNKIISLFGGFGNRLSKKMNISGLASKMGSGFSSVFSKISGGMGKFGNKLSSSFKNGRNAFSQFKNDLQQGFSNIGGSAKKATGTIKGFVVAIGLVKAAGAVFNVLKGSIGGAISRFDTMRQFPKVMQQLGFSAQESKGSITKLSDGIEGLPTTLDQVVESTQQMTSISGDLSKSTDATIAFNNAMLASGASSDKAARGLDQYMQMLSTGKVDLNSWETLQKTMPLGLQKIAEGFGFAGKAAQNDLFSALKDGTITFDQFQDKLIELGTGTGELANIAKTVSEGIKTSFGNMGNAIKKGIETVMTKADELSQKLTGKTIAKHLDGVKEIINSVFSSIAKSMDKLPVLIKRLEPFISAIKNGFDTIKGPIQKAVDAVSESLGKLMDSFDSSANVDGFTSAIDLITDTVTGLANFITEHSDGIAKLISMLPKLAGAFVGFKIAKSLGSNLMTIGKGISVISKAGIGLAAKLIGIAGGHAAVGVSAPIAAAGETAAGSAASASAPQILALGAAVVLAGLGFVLAAVGIWLLVDGAIRLAAAGMPAALALGAIVLSLGIMIGLFAALGPALTAGAVGMLAFGLAIVLIGAGLNLAAPGLAELPPIISAIGDAFSVAAGAIGSAVSEIVGTVSGLVDSLASGVATVISAIGTAASTVIESVATFVNSVGDSISKILETISTGVSKVIDSIGGAISNVLDSIAGIFKSIGEAARDAGVGMEKMANAIEKISSFGIIDLGKTMTSIASGLKSLASNSAGLSEVGVAMTDISNSLVGMGESVEPLIRLASVIPTLASTMVATNGQFSTFSETIGQIGASVTTAIAPITLLGTTSTILSAALIASIVGIVLFNSQVITLASTSVLASAGMMILANATTSTNSSITMLSATFTSLITAVNTGAVAFVTASALMSTSISTSMNEIKASVSTAMTEFTSIVRSGMSSAVSAVTTGSAQIVNAFSSLKSQLYSAGVNAMSGLAAGISAGQGSALAAASSVANAVSAKIKSALKIHSPSRVMMEIGKFIPDGVAVGIRNGIGLVERASTALADSIVPTNYAALSGSGSFTSYIGINDDNIGQLKASAASNVVVKNKQVVPQVIINVDNSDGQPIDTDSLLEEFENKIIELMDADLS